MPIGAFKLNGISRILGGPPAFNTITATGGTITDYQDSVDGIYYRSHTFITSRVKKAVTMDGGQQTQISTAQSKFGGASALFDGGGDNLFCHNHSDYVFGTGNFTIELWVYNASWAATEYIFDWRNTASQVAPALYYSSGLKYYVNGSIRITGGTLTTNTWHHIVITRSGTDTKLFVNGTQSGSTYTDSNNYLAPGAVRFGTDYNGANGYSGYMDEIRISNSARYTTTFTSPSAAFTNDSNTVLLLHCNGTNASQRFEDDASVTNTFSVSSLGSSNGKVQYLIVGGGGGGGSHDGLYRTPGGGGGGGVKTGTNTVTTTSYTVNIGAAGVGGIGRIQFDGNDFSYYPTNPPINGNDSSVFSVTSAGGGGGGMYTSPGQPGNAGGSGGGGGSGDGVGPWAGGSGTAGQGSAGGQCYANGAAAEIAGGGGGGGSTGTGSASDFANNKGGNGGAGSTNTYRDGTVRSYGGGGGGAGHSTTQNDTSKGGSASHGGGAGNAYGRGTSGTNDTGGGGGGGNGLGYFLQSGGDGGTGIVVIRYPLNSANNLP